jgi:glyoxylase I family protein
MRLFEACTVSAIKSETWLVRSRFYTTHLGFTVEHEQRPPFASISLGDAQILLSGPPASGSRPMPNGQQQEPGGWNRVVLRVNDLQTFIETLKKAGLHFRNDMETGPGGKQIQIDDPDGNPIGCSNLPDRSPAV